MLAVKIHNNKAGQLSKSDSGEYVFLYDKSYQGQAISLTMPVRDEPYVYNSFPPFFDGLLPEGVQLDGLLRINKIDKNDFMQQLIMTGADLVGAVTVEELK